MDNLMFCAINSEKPDLPFSQLAYKDLHRFKQLLQKCQNNELGELEFFQHAQNKHLLYPYKANNGSIEILLLSTHNNTINELFERKPKKD